MAECQEDIDALLAEVSALADEAVSDIGGNEPDEPAPAHPAAAPPATAPLASSQPAARPRGGSVVCGARPHEDPRRILQLEVPVIVRLAERTMPMKGILGLTTGAIIEFDKPSDGQLDLMINNKCIGLGQAVKLGENFGLRVTTIGSLQDRIRAMGGD